MADAMDSKSIVGDNVWVQVPPSAPKKERKLKNLRSFLVLIQKRPDPLSFRKRIGVIISDF